MDVSIRPASMADEAAFTELACGLTLYNQPHRPANDDLQQRLQKRSEQAQEILHTRNPERLLLIAFSDSQPAGYVLAYTEKVNKSCIGYIDELFVSPSIRGQGIGSRLMEAAGDKLKAAGALALRLNVFSWNGAAQGFYERLGFVQHFVVYQKQI